jgi:Na+/melibiose symporter-like transporter
VDESFLIDACHDAKHPKKSVREVFKQMILPFAHDNAKRYLTGTLFFNLGFRIVLTVVIPVFTYVLLLQGSQFIEFALILIPIGIGAFLGWTLWGQKHGTLPSYLSSLKIMCITLFITFLFLIPFPQPVLLGFAIVVIGIIIASMVGGMLFPNPIMSAIIDEAPQKLGTERINTCGNLAGGYFGMNNFILNTASGVANLVLGVIFTGGNEKNPTYLTISLPIAAVFFTIAFLFLKRIILIQKVKEIGKK